ncbi:MAG: hypothetical protein M1820_007497 [Bogoriella megaspora]|nr:MAG: hypothetical protein M1820_007497 [Bogoriella megaspora]
MGTILGAVCLCVHLGKLDWDGGSGKNVIKSGAFDVTSSFWSCSTSFPWTTTSVGSPLGFLGSTQLTGSGQIESTAEYIFVYSEKDIKITTTRSSSSKTQPITQSTIQSSVNQTITDVPKTTSTATTTTITAKPSSDLSGGAEAGIGIGTALVILALIAVVVLYFLRRKAKARRGANVRHHMQNLDCETITQAELQAKSEPSELPACQAILELPEQCDYSELA